MWRSRSVTKKWSSHFFHGHLYVWLKDDLWNPEYLHRRRVNDLLCISIWKSLSHTFLELTTEFYDVRVKETIPFKWRYKKPQRYRTSTRPRTKRFVFSRLGGDHVNNGSRRYFPRTLSTQCSCLYIREGQDLQDLVPQWCEGDLWDSLTGFVDRIEDHWRSFRTTRNPRQMLWGRRRRNFPTV